MTQTEEVKQTTLNQAELLLMKKVNKFSEEKSQFGSIILIINVYGQVEKWKDGTLLCECIIYFCLSISRQSYATGIAKIPKLIC